MWQSMLDPPQVKVSESQSQSQVPNEKVKVAHVEIHKAMEFHFDLFFECCKSYKVESIKFKG